MRRVNITPALVARIARKVARGERVRSLAQTCGIRNKYGYEKLRKAVRAKIGRRLTPGREAVRPINGGTPQKYREYYERLHGRGAAERFLHAGAGRTFPELGHTYGRSKSWAERLWHNLGGSARRRGRPWTRRAV